MPNLTACSTEEWDEVLPGISRPPNPSQTSDLRFNPAPLRDYETAMRRQVDRGIIPGYCSAVVLRDRVLHIDTYGYRDVARGLPMCTDTIVRLFCMTKAVVATGLMVLVEREVCALDDDVATYIPALGAVAIAATESDGGRGGKITLRRLLTHTAGLGYGKEFNLRPESAAEQLYAPLVNAVASGEVDTIDEFCRRLAALPLPEAPGVRFEYSHGLDIIGRVIEVASGQPLDRFLEEQLFRPLGMKDTGFAVPEEKLERLAILYGSADTARALGQKPRVARGKPAHALVPIDGRSPSDSAWAEGRHCKVLSGGGLMGHNSGGLVSTLNDQLRFFLMLARGGQAPGGARVLQERTVREMVGRNWLPECTGQPQHLGEGVAGVVADGPFGWNALGELGVVADPTQIKPDGYELGEYGYAGIAETFWSVNPRRDLVTLWFTQQVDNFSWTEPEANLWIASRTALGPVPRPPPPATPRARSRSPARRRRRIVGKCRPPRG